MAKAKYLSLEPPQPSPNNLDVNREEWIESIVLKFVAPDQANRGYYRVFLETLWPVGHGIPGPHVTQAALIEAIEHYRRDILGITKPYRDAFRRLRELQGEEGLSGIAKEGTVYQLVNLDVGAKRTPRVKLSDEIWDDVLLKYHYQCAVCGRQEPEVKFDQDHKIPRVRGGNNEPDNWQPLCVECNNFKSTACRGCSLDCLMCAWAFPEKYAPIKLTADNTLRLRALARQLQTDVHTLTNALIMNCLKEEGDLLDNEG